MPTHVQGKLMHSPPIDLTMNIKVLNETQTLKQKGASTQGVKLRASSAAAMTQSPTKTLIKLMNGIINLSWMHQTCSKCGRKDSILHTIFCKTKKLKSRDTLMQTFTKHTIDATAFNALLQKGASLCMANCNQIPPDIKCLCRGMFPDQIFQLMQNTSSKQKKELNRLLMLHLLECVEERSTNRTIKNDPLIQKEIEDLCAECQHNNMLT